MQIICHFSQFKSISVFQMDIDWWYLIILPYNINVSLTIAKKNSVVNAYCRILYVFMYVDCSTGKAAFMSENVEPNVTML